jgi:uncharacterized protein
MTAEQLRGNAADEMARGRAALAEAEKLMSADLPYGAASRAYYAAFHFARALCWAAGETPRTHQGVAHFLRVHFIRTGKLPPDTDRKYTSLQSFREQADYESAFTIDAAGAHQVVGDARTLIERMEKLLHELGA